MTIDDFFMRCEELWPGKGLTLNQRALYGGKLLRFDERQIGRIFDWLSENSKFFPKVADIYDAARHCSILDKPGDHRPHEWNPTDCRLCGGSGQLAVFYEQEFDPKDQSRTLMLKRVMQYESSQTTSRTTEWTRYLFRCSCPQGDASTLQKGIPRWNPDKPSILRLSL